MNHTKRTAVIEEAKTASKFSSALLRRMTSTRESIHEAFADLRTLEGVLYKQLFALQCACPHPEKTVSPPFGKAGPPNFCGICGARVG